MVCLRARADADCSIEEKDEDRRNRLTHDDNISAPTLATPHKDLAERFSRSTDHRI